MPCLCLPFSSPVVLFSHPLPFSSPVYSERSSACFGSATSSSSLAPSAPPLRRLARQPPSSNPLSPKPSPPPDVKLPPSPPDPELLPPDREPPPPDPSCRRQIGSRRHQVSSPPPLPLSLRVLGAATVALLRMSRRRDALPRLTALPLRRRLSNALKTMMLRHGKYQQFIVFLGSAS
jgi:hypothetical protein